jgi:hypothetical protein
MADTSGKPAQVAIDGNVRDRFYATFADTDDLVEVDGAILAHATADPYSDLTKVGIDFLPAWERGEGVRLRSPRL